MITPGEAGIQAARFAYVEVPTLNAGRFVGIAAAQVGSYQRFLRA